MQIGGFRLSWLRRRWWVLALSILAVVGITALARPSTANGYRSEALLIVRSGATTSTPGNANEANRLAVTYSQLIPQDSLVTERAGRTLGVSRDVVQRNLSVVNDSGTSILRVRYQAPRTQSAIDGARAVADALAGPNPVASNFNGLALSRIPDSATSTAPESTTYPAAALIGLCLGVVLVIALERMIGRIDRAEDVERDLVCPVSSLQGLSTGAIGALLNRWSALAGGTPTQIAVLAATPGHRAVTGEVATALATNAPLAGGEEHVAGLKGMTLRSAGSPATTEVGEATAQASDLTVLVVMQGTRSQDLKRSVHALEDFGVTPSWALFASRAVVRRASKNQNTDEPVVIDVGNSALPIS